MIRSASLSVVGSLAVALAGIVACSSTDEARGASSAPSSEPPASGEGDADVDPDVAAGAADAGGEAGLDASLPYLPPYPSADPALVAKVGAYRASVATAICAKLSGCCSDADYDVYFAQYNTSPFNLASPPPRAQCVSVLASTLARRYDLYLPAVSLGRMNFDANKAQSCVASIDAAVCGVSLTNAIYDGPCFALRGNQVFPRLGQVGDSCRQLKDGTFNGDCNVGVAYCGANGKCKAWSQVGETCNLLGQYTFCAPALNCESDTPTKPGKCSGAPITRAVGESCNAITGPTQLCAQGFYCDGKVCVAQKGDGMACQFDEECQTARPFTCSPVGAGTCGATSFCSP